MSDLANGMILKMEENCLESLIDDRNDKPSSTELLGSVTTINCPGVRTSARVIQKMKQDSIIPITPPPHEKKDLIKDDKSLQKTPSQPKAPKFIWTNVEKNLFFDALNEFGKDFESISNFINSKIKRKVTSDQSFKSKEQIRQLYYQTLHKISKYLRFSEDVKKPAQELYALINYGEMRRKLVFVSEKNCMKMKDLVYKGYVIVRSKGKNIRIKTPSCKALRKLNQLEDWQEDIILPSKIEVYLRPATMESWGRVQNIAQNPIVQTTVPLQKKLINIIKTFQYRWRDQEVKLHEHSMKLVSNTNNIITSENKPVDFDNFHYQESLICFSPQPNAIIHRPMLNLTEYLSNFSICLNSYEKKIGAKIRGETLCQDRFANKRQRSDSGCEKKSPDNKKFKNDQDNKHNDNDSASERNDKDSIDNLNSDDLTDEIRDILSDDDFFKSNKQNTNEIENLQNDLLLNSYDGKCLITKDNASEIRQRKKEIRCSSGTRRRGGRREISNLKPLLNEDAAKKIRNGWTILNAGDITVGDLYVMFGQDSKIILEYQWHNINDENSLKKAKSSVPYNVNVNVNDSDRNYVNSIRTSALGNKLRHLLIIASLSERMKRKTCSCGHICDRSSKIKRGDGEIITKSYVSNKTYTSSHTDFGVFRQPTAPFRKTILPSDNFRLNVQRFKQSRILKNRTIPSKQVVVQRLLPVQPGVTDSYDVVNSIELKTIPEEEKAIVSNLPSDETKVEEISKSTISDINLVKVINEKLIKNKEISSNDVVQPQNENTVCTNSDSINQSELGVDNDEELGLMDITLPSPFPIASLDDSSVTFNEIPPMSPMRILRDGPVDEKWLEDNMNDFSLSSLLGHLDEINQDIAQDNTNISIISETSVDYMTKFAELAASIQNEGKDL